jgi:hypothetical protein
MESNGFVDTLSLVDALIQYDERDLLPVKVPTDHRA